MQAPSQTIRNWHQNSRGNEMAKMRAKMKVTSVVGYNNGPDGTRTQENLTFSAVGPSGNYPADGSDENNTFARFTPNAQLNISILNPALFGQFKLDEKYYVDFTEASQ
jgi:hypothetical protein